MKLKKSFYNSHIIRHDLMYFGWIVGLYVLLLFLSGPIASLSGKEKFARYMVDLMNFDSKIFLFTIVVIPILLGIFQFKYLHSTTQIARMHSYPFHRYEILGTKIFTGTLTIVIPQLFFMLFVLVCYPATEFVGDQVLHSPLNFMLLTVMYMMGLYMFTVAVSMISGFTMAALAMTLIFFSVPYGLLSLIFHNLQMTLRGFFYNSRFIENIMVKLSPFTLISEMQASSVTPATVFSGLFFIFGCMILAFFLYAKRQDEMAGDVVAFEPLKPVFVVGVTICSIFVGGTYISTIYETETALFIGYLLGGTIGYYVSQMVLDKRFNIIKKHLKGYAVVMASVILFQGILFFDITGFEKRVPDRADISSVIFEDFYQIYDENQMVYASPDNIREICDLHSKLNREDVGSPRGKTFYLQYNLKNGTKIKRSYSVDEMRYKEIFDVLYGSTEYKSQKYDIFNLSESDVSMVMMESNEFWNNREKISDPNDIKRLIGLLKQDILDADADALVFNRYDHAHLTFYSADQNVNVNVSSNINSKTIRALEDEIGLNVLVDIPLNANFEKTKNWLDKLGLLESIALKPESASYIVLEEVENESKATTILSTESKAVTITDEAEMDLILNHMSYGEYFSNNEPYYVVGVGMKNKLDSMVYAYVRRSDLSEEILSHFK